MANSLYEHVTSSDDYLVFDELQASVKKYYTSRRNVSASEVEDAFDTAFQKMCNELDEKLG